MLDRILSMMAVIDEIETVIYTFSTKNNAL